MDVVADGTVPSPPPPPPPPPPPARGRSRLALAIADAVMCLCLANIWLHAAGMAARDLGRITCGEKCFFLVSAAASVASVSEEFMIVALAVTALLFLIRVENSDSEEEVPVNRKLEAAAREVMPTVMLRMMGIGLFLLLLIATLGDLLKGYSPVKGSAMEQIGSAFSVVGIFGLEALGLIFIPIVALRLWRVTRPGWRCSTGTENQIENP